MRIGWLVESSEAAFQPPMLEKLPAVRLKRHHREILAIGGVGVVEGIQIVGGEIRDVVAIEIVQHLLNCSRRAVADDLKCHGQRGKTGNRRGLKLDRVVQAAIGIGDSRHGDGNSIGHAGQILDYGGDGVCAGCQRHVPGLEIGAVHESGNAVDGDLFQGGGGEIAGDIHPRGVERGAVRRTGDGNRGRHGIQNEGCFLPGLIGFRRRPRKPIQTSCAP